VFFTNPRGAGITKTGTTLDWCIITPPAFYGFEDQLAVQSVNTPPPFLIHPESSLGVLDYYKPDSVFFY